MTASPAEPHLRHDGPKMPTSVQPKGWLFLGLLMLLLGSRAVFFLDGAVGALRPGGSGDLFGRYSEFQWVQAGQDPHPALRRLRSDAGRWSPPGEGGVLPERSEIAVGHFSDGDFSEINIALAHYPQWSYALLAPLLLVPWPATMWVMLGLNGLGLLVLLRWARSLLDGWWGWVSVFAFLIPMHAWSVGLVVGQLSVLIMAGQVLLLHALASQRSGLAATSLGWLAVKPTSSALFGWFALLPWLQGRAPLRFSVRTVAGVALLIVGATVAVWAWTATPPWIWMRQVFMYNSYAAEAGYGVLTLAENSLPNVRRNTLLAALTGFVLQGAAIWFFRRSSLLVHFAVAGLISRFWAYHRHYDDVLLVFLMLALVVECRRGSWLCGIALLVLASAYGTPTPSSELMNGWRIGVSVLALVVLLVEHRARTVSVALGDPGRRRLLDGLHQDPRRSVA